MFDLNGRLLALTALVAAVNPTEGFSEIVYTFHHGGELDGASKDETATFPADDLSGIVGTITTIEVVQSDETTGGTLNENDGRLGINKPDGTANDEFNGSESWMFSWDIDTTLDFIDFNAFTGSETMTIKSPDWIEKDFMIEEDRNLDFNRSAGVFTFGDDVTDAGHDAFDLTTIISGDSLLVSAHTPYTLTYGSNGGAAEIGALTFSAPASSSTSSTAAPEPGSAVGLLGLAGAAVGRRWHRKRKNRRESRTDGL